MADKSEQEKPERLKDAQERSTFVEHSYLVDAQSTNSLINNMRSSDSNVLKSFGSLTLVDEKAKDTIPKQGNLQEFRDKMRNSEQPIPKRGWDTVQAPDDIAKRVGDSNVIFYGEDHSGDRTRAEQFSDALKKLQKTYGDKLAVALEGWDKDSIDKYLKPYLDGDLKNQDKEAAENAIKAYIDQRFPNSKTGFVDKMMDFVRALKEAKITSDHVIGLDPADVRINGGDKSRREQDPKANERNEQWAKEISDYLNDHSDSKVLVVGGGHWDSPPNFRKANVSELLRRNKDVKMVDLTPSDIDWSGGGKP